MIDEDHAYEECPECRHFYKKVQECRDTMQHRDVYDKKKKKAMCSRLEKRVH